jgi:hypothetical protein
MSIRNICEKGKWFWRSWLYLPSQSWCSVKVSMRRWYFKRTAEERGQVDISGKNIVGERRTFGFGFLLAYLCWIPGHCCSLCVSVRRHVIEATSFHHPKQLIKQTEILSSSAKATQCQEMEGTRLSLLAITLSMQFLWLKRPKVYTALNTKNS